MRYSADSVMKSSGRQSLHRPFEGLKDLLATDELPDTDGAVEPTEAPSSAPADPDEDERLFRDAMAGVKRISCRKSAAGRTRKPAAVSDRENEDLEVLMKLRGLVQRGSGFVVADTSEYIEGSGCLAPPEITRRLHRGDFSIQGHLDLHGLRVAEAEAAFEDFLTESIGAGKRAVLVIHGRGLSSPAQPVLKTKVYQWLTRNRWRKWVIAFTSARSCDGGAGASYVLLRHQPLTKAQRRKRRR